MAIHIGKEIKEELERQERGVSWLAEKLHCDRTNVYNIFKRQGIDTRLLERISVILNRNFYCFAFNEYSVSFRRFENNVEVGSYHQGIKWKKKKRVDQEWTLVKEADELAFSVDGQEIIRIRYMPLAYCGVGFYTIGKQGLAVDKIEYEQ